MILLTGAVALAGIVVAGVLLVDRDGNTPGPDPTTAPPSSSQPTAPSSTEPPGPSPEDQLAAILPGDFDASSCSSTALAGDGDVAAVVCGQASTQPGPTTATFRLYQSGTVDGVFLNDVTVFGLPAHAVGQACPDWLGYSGYTNNGEVRGRAACYVDTDGGSYLAWTEDEYDTEAVVTIANGGLAGVYVLWNWWTDPAHSAFGG
jgi:serine/threonine-protein kinase